MHSTFRQISFAMLATAMCLGACKKDEAEAPSSDNNGGGGSTTSTPSSTPTFAGADGVLWAINTFSTQTVAGVPFEVEAGLGSAAFPSESNASVLVDAGAVSLNDIALTRNSNNTYITIPSTSNPTGVDLSGGNTHWVVAGANGIPALDQSPSFSFPDVGDITSSTTVTRSSGYTLSVASISPCDSVVFMVGSVVKYLPSGNTSCTFTASELSSVASGASLVQVSPYSYSHQVIGGKNFYFGKQTTRTVSATIQ
ncbi:MAG: hypothetical protein JSU02_08275 [Bacteroidetes bacterium]|nr:hypothetical protein [Bacteroidota bacterium]